MIFSSSSLFYIIDLIIATTNARNILFYDERHLLSLYHFGGFLHSSFLGALLTLL